MTTLNLVTFALTVFLAGTLGGLFVGAGLRPRVTRHDERLDALERAVGPALGTPNPRTLRQVVDSVDRRLAETVARQDARTNDQILDSIETKADQALDLVNRRPR